MNTQSRTGFTLIELLVVVGLVAALVAVLSPALAKTKPNGQATQCLNNLRQLTAAWRMYADDNSDGLVYNTDGNSLGKITGPNGMYVAGWVGGWLDFTASNLDNTNVNLLIAHSPNINLPYGWSGFLGPYLNTPLHFHCAADKSAVQTGGSVPLRVRSYSMNNYTGAEGRTWKGQHASASTTTAQRQGSSVYPLLQKTTDIASPNNTFVFLDEREDSINDGCFFSDPDTPYQLVDYPAGRHGRAGGLSFADGHSEIHRWQDPRTVPMSAGQGLPLNINLPNDVDITWLAHRAVGLP
jgi:prepilin-type N-terminal cleavage/methylation domain-containing protein/prepilin-type processing-associated H-X9-DG protein